ncbi:het-domain protein, partial [Cladorrhinum sp. PSN332]
TLQYMYRPLKEGEIRLAKLHARQPRPGTHFIPAITIVHQQLEEIKGQYDALSYVWGNTDPCNMRLLGSLRMLVQRLAQEKNSLPQPKKLVWVDAICINQADDDEKSRQVTKMRDIYHSAAQTVAYLGDERDDSKVFMWFMSRIAQQFGREMEKSFGKKALIACLVEQSLASTFQGTSMGKLLQNRRIMRSLALLLARPYFQRIWTVQELAVSENSRMYCGLDSCIPMWLFLFLSHTVISAGIQLADQIGEHDTRMDMCRGLAQFTGMMDTYTHVRDDFVEYRGLHLLLQRFRSSQATNELDKIYALLGLSSDKSLKEFPIDYRTTKAELFTKVAHFIAHDADRGANLIYEAARSEYNPRSGLPSWVPDWTELPVRTNLGATLSASARGFWDASDNTKRTAEGNSLGRLVIEIAPQGNILRVKAALLQRVVTLGSTPPEPNSQGGSTALNTAHLVNVIDDLVKFKQQSLGSSTEYYRPTGEPIDTALGILLEADQIRQSGAALTTLYEDNGSRSFLYGFDVKVLEQAILLHRGSERQGFLSQVYAGDRTAIHNMIRATVGRRFGVTDGRFAGLVPSQTEVRDWICVLDGATVPFVLREREEEGGRSFGLVGDCYVHGMMLGEMFNDEGRQPEMKEIVI